MVIKVGYIYLLILLFVRMAKKIGRMCSEFIYNKKCSRKFCFVSEVRQNKQMTKNSLG